MFPWASGMMILGISDQLIGPEGRRPTPCIFNLGYFQLWVCFLGFELTINGGASVLVLGLVSERSSESWQRYTQYHGDTVYPHVKSWQKNRKWNCEFCS
jgi:hypothetical protein